MEVKKIAVIGAGLMGSGIAQVAATAKYDVMMTDMTEERISKALDSISWSLKKFAEKGKITEPADAVFARIQTATGPEAAADADLVIEAVFEKVEVKLELLGELDGICRPGAVIASNTSTIPITLLSKALGNPEKCIGMHFFSPVPMMTLLEIIPTERTSQDTLDTALEVGQAMGKNTIVVKKDIPGFLMNRIFGQMVCEAVRLVESGAGSVEDIDTGMCQGFAMRMGPLAIADLAGLDISLHAFSNIHDLDPEGIPAPPELLKRLVSEGKLGRKSGEGFYRYDEKGKNLGAAM